jgi:hypothetical protein
MTIKKHLPNEQKPGYNTGLAKVAARCSSDTFVVAESLVLRINPPRRMVKIATFAKPENVEQASDLQILSKTLLPCLGDPPLKKTGPPPSRKAALHKIPVDRLLNHNPPMRNTLPTRDAHEVGAPRLTTQGHAGLAVADRLMQQQLPGHAEDFEHAVLG